MQLVCLSFASLDILRPPNSIEDYVSLGFILLLLLWLWYDFLYLHWMPRLFLKRQMKEVQTLALDSLSKSLIYNLSHINLDKFPEEVQKLPYFRGIQRQFAKIFQTSAFQQKYLAVVLPRYQQLVSQTIFHELWPPRCREDLVLVDYKCQHQQREIAFAVVAIQKQIEAQMPQDLTPLVKELLQQHHQQLQKLRAAIQKDQDALPILGMAIPMNQAAELIANSGEDFDVTGIQVKSLCSIAGHAPTEDWELFCRLLLKAAQGSINNFVSSFSYDPGKGETVPLKFLLFLKDWIERNHIVDPQSSHFNYIRERLSQLGSNSASSTNGSRMQRPQEDKRHG